MVNNFVEIQRLTRVRTFIYNTLNVNSNDRQTNKPTLLVWEIESVRRTDARLIHILMLDTCTNVPANVPGLYQTLLYEFSAIFTRVT